jgi:acetate kinase
MQGLGLALDIVKNKQVNKGMREISTAQSRVKIMEISTNEELAIARATIGLL